MKIIIQHDERDCGAACLAMIASHYKAYYPLAQIRELTKTDKTGTTIYGIVIGAENLGLKATALSGTADELINEISEGKISFPFIAHIVSETSLLHFVVSGISNGKVTVYDPAKGKKQIRADQFFSSTTGYYIIFEKTASFRQGNFKKGAFFKFFSLLKGQYVKLTGIIIISLIISIIGIMGAFVFESIIDHFATENGYYTIETAHNHSGEEHSDEENPLIYILEKISGDNSELKYNHIFVLIIGMYLL